MKILRTTKILFYRAKTKRISKGNLKPIIVYLNNFSASVIEKYGNKNNKPDNFVFNIISRINSAEEQIREIQNYFFLKIRTSLSENSIQAMS